MKFSFKLRGKTVNLSLLEDVVAVRPAQELRAANRSGAGVAKALRTVMAQDDTAGGKFGVQLPAKNRRVYQRAGWLFVDAPRDLKAAAERRGAAAGTDAVRPILVDRSGQVVVGTDLVTVQFPADTTDAQAREGLKAAGLRLVRRLRFAKGLFEARLPARVPLAEAIAAVQADQRFVFAEPTFLQPIGGRMTPTDPNYPDQWQHANDGSNGGTVGADIKSQLAWDKTRGAGVRIAVIDNGMNVNHPDLKAGVVGGGHFDDDGTGGATFVRHTPGGAGFPAGNHGTFCLGMAGARMNNSRGGCGSAPEADLIPIACLTDQIGTLTTLARAVAYAADPTTETPSAPAGSGADVIACSLGANGADWNITTALDLALRAAASGGRGGRGVPIFWAVSNAGFDIALDEVASHPEVIGVGRSNRNDLDDGSATGARLAFLAPGHDVYSTRSTGYGFDTGTSYAAPLAAGVGALVLARNPSWTRDQVLDRLKATCDKIGGVVYNANGHHPDYGHGRLNAGAAV